MESELSDSSATHIAKCLEKKKILKLRVCNYLGCQSQFDSRFNLRRHILLVHTKIRPFKCDLCEKRFGLNQHRLEHLTTHNLKEDTIQEIAEKKLTLRGSLPVFKVEHGDHEIDKLQSYIHEAKVPRYVERGVMPYPENFRF
eukprot:CAMPEP_0114991576 /NCGR_PEP_ID=MMETSP0216-20121206/11451_1 /TAXON_ID=223996 /ORGANISM="Protocruzia adherens, Strain Boccale" /LENGTH=141 /DNA_ID=CAMNT_0002354923 /DNA_START=574 /DNA_END=999 /DNA_ORIENTATION=-